MAKLGLQVLLRGLVEMIGGALKGLKQRIYHHQSRSLRARLHQQSTRVVAILSGVKQQRELLY